MSRWFRAAENKKVIHVDLWENGYQDAEAKDWLTETGRQIVSEYCSSDEDFKVIPEETGFTIYLLKDIEDFDGLVNRLKQVKSFEKVY